MRSALDLMAAEAPTASSRTKRFTFSLASALSRRQALPSERNARARTCSGTGTASPPMPWVAAAASACCVWLLTAPASSRERISGRSKTRSSEVIAGGMGTRTKGPLPAAVAAPAASFLPFFLLPPPAALEDELLISSSLAENPRMATAPTRKVARSRRETSAAMSPSRGPTTKARRTDSHASRTCVQALRMMPAPSSGVAAVWWWIGEKGGRVV
jgi:hypothetical protein